MDKYLFFSGDTPSIEDENFSRDAIIAAILDRTKDLFSDGYVTGFSLSKDAAELVLSPGVAYLDGERIYSASEVRVAYPGTNKYAFVKYEHTDGSPKNHPITGTPNDTRRTISFSLVLKDSSAPSSGELLLGQVFAAGSITDKREFIEVADPRVHDQNTDTGTDSATFTVDGNTVLTEANAIETHPELELLFRAGIINLQDGHGDRLVETRKIPSKPNAPTLDAGNVQLIVHDANTANEMELRHATDNWQAARASVETLDTHISLLSEYRSLINQKRLSGYTLDQVRGDADVGGSPDNDVRTKKNETIVAGAGANSREPGVVAITSGLDTLTGTGTSFTVALEGKTILLQADGLLKEYVVDTVNSATSITLSAAVSETAADAYFYLAADDGLGYGSAVSTITDMVSAVDAQKVGKVSSRETVREEQLSHGNRVLELYTGEMEFSRFTYSLLLSWTKPSLVDLEEITHYRVRVYEITSTRTVIPAGITRQQLEAAHISQVFAVHDHSTNQRMRTEGVNASDTTTTGSTTTLVKLVGTTVFRPGDRVEVNGERGVIRSFNQSSRIIELVNPLPAAPPAGVGVSSFEVVFEGDVWAERFMQTIRGGQHLVLFVQAVSEYGLVSDWSAGLPVLTDELEDAEGRTMAELLAILAAQQRTRFEVERDRISSQFEDDVFALQRAVDDAAKQAEVDSLNNAVEELQATA